MKPKLIELPTHKSSPPHCCVVSGRRDGPIVDFGDPTQKARGPGDPRIYLRGFVVEEAARELLGMVPLAEVETLRQELAECDEERKRLGAIVAGTEDLSAAEDNLRTALGPSQADPDDGTAPDEETQP